MPMSPNIRDREHDKFLEDANGDTSVRVGLSAVEKDKKWYAWYYSDPTKDLKDNLHKSSRDPIGDQR